MKAQTWRDTVMSPYRILEAGLVNPTYARMHGKECPLSWERVAKAQAEITWKARDPEIVEARKAGREAERAFILQNTDRDVRARKEGIKEVGEWVNDHSSCGVHKTGLYSPIKPKHIEELRQGIIPKE